MAVVTPFDKTALRNIEQAIRDSDLGVNPSNDGNIIRVVFPELTEERRRDYIKVAKTKAEDCQDLDPLHPPQGQGRHRQADQGRRGRRGRGPPRGEGARRHHRASTSRRWTSCSSTRKPSCSRSDERLFLGGTARRSGASRLLGGRRTWTCPGGCPGGSRIRCARGAADSPHAHRARRTRVWRRPGDDRATRERPRRDSRPCAADTVRRPPRRRADPEPMPDPRSRPRAAEEARGA